RVALALTYALPTNTNRYDALLYHIFYRDELGTFLTTGNHDLLNYSVVELLFLALLFALWFHA
ncbi:hypothetical protein, partial [Xenorhabdus beddingii]|uniref:hypothetical protein n=1 Tax=Xenorhabdus beddingii TaxID=40578 RepID=UPI001ABFD442